MAEATLVAGMMDTHQIYVKNTFAPTGALYQVNAFVAKGVAITLGKQNRDNIQQSMTMDYVIGQSSSAAPALAPEAAVPTGTSEQARQLLSYLYAPTLTPWALLLALMLAVVLGGVHALTPGHGKTLVAAYLVGSRGTLRHAVLLGSATTVTHTVSVIGVGLLSDQTHDHGFGPHTHAFGDGEPAHASMARVSGGGILAMGVSGGLVPCPEALGIMLVAIGLNRAGLGLALIVAFSLGLAAVLIGLGIVLVRSKSLIERVGGFGACWRQPFAQVSRWLPLVSAFIVTLLGVGLVLKGALPLAG